MHVPHVFGLLDVVEDLHGADEAEELPQHEEHGLQHDDGPPEKEHRLQIGQTPR